MVRATAIGLVMAAWMGGMASAQVTQLNTGQQLDANYQIGSGGYNTVTGGTGGVNTQLNSQLYVSGQVSGLANFRGRVPYFAPDQLHLALPSSALDTFRQQSASLRQATLGQSYVTQPYYTGMQTVLGATGISEGRTLPGTNMPINTQAQPQMAKTYDELLKDYKPLMPQGSGVPMIDTLVPTGARLAGDAPIVSTFQPGGATIGLPVFGMAGKDERKLSAELYELGQAEQPGNRIQTMQENQPRTATGEPTPLSPLGGGAPQPGAPGKTPGLNQPGTSGEMNPDADGGKGSTLNPIQTPANTLTKRPQDEIGRPGPQMQTLGVGTPGQVAIPVDPNSTPGTPGQMIPVPAVPGGQTLGGPYRPVKTVETVPQPENDDAYYNLMLQMMKKRSAERNEADQTGQATPGLSTAGKSSSALGSARPAGDTLTSPLQPAARTKLSGTEGSSGVVVYSLAGKSNDIFNGYMAAAQEKLKAGRYYEASATFESALIVNPSNPLARVGAMIAYFAAGEPYTAGYHLQAALQIFPPLMETKMEVLKLVDESLIRERLNQLDLRLEKHPETLNAVLLLTTTYMHANLDQPELAKQYAALLHHHCGEDKLLEAYAQYVITGELPKVAKTAATAPAKPTTAPAK